MNKYKQPTPKVNTVPGFNVKPYVRPGLT